MPIPSHESNLRIRKACFGRKLEAAGWEVVPFDFQIALSSVSHHAIKEWITHSGPSDYALTSGGRRAAAPSCCPTTRPNGEVIWFHDIRRELERSITRDSIDEPRHPRPRRRLVRRQSSSRRVRRFLKQLSEALAA